jgi:hypothetical protein
MSNVIVQSEPRIASILIEVPVTVNGQGRIPFPDVAQLRSTTDVKIVIKVLRLITDAVLTNSVLVAGVTAPLTELQKMTAVIYSDQWEKGQYIPLLTLNDVITPGTLAPYRYGAPTFNDWTNVDWPKSYIQLANGLVTAGQPYVVLFDCQYVRLNAQGLPLDRPSK